jgi:hypothetical protein
MQEMILGASDSGAARRLGIAQPWTALAIVAFVLNLGWEMLQAPLYSSVRGRGFGEGTLQCHAAAIGDAAITLLAFGIVAAFAGDRAWMLRPCRFRITAYLVLGLGFTMVLETMALRSGRWTYAAAMPRVAGIGRSPVAATAQCPRAHPLHLVPLCERECVYGETGLT